MKLLERARFGGLTLVLPDGEAALFDGCEPGPTAQLEIRDWKVFGDVARHADIGLARAIRDGTADSPDLTSLFRWAIANATGLDAAYSGSRVGAILGRLLRFWRRNTRTGSRRNIMAHYDLGNAFYALWLDRGMTYSSGLYRGLGEPASLDDAQQAKYEQAVVALDIGPHHRVLEIGCGWGAFAEYAARTRGAHVTAITISPAQHAYARERVARAGLSDRVDVRLCDYRDVQGAYDRICSIEMLEAVGQAFWPRYFSTLARVLKPGGRALVQTITIRDDAFADYAVGNDFIREFIFPGGMLPSPAEYVAQARAAGLEEVGRLCFGPDYARTLREWRARFERVLPEVRSLGFDDAFVRLWRMYLCYCEAGFDAGHIDVMQSQLVHAG
jgi:cyclopropane-fatty-acyl-phospholipid synthase